MTQPFPSAVVRAALVGAWMLCACHGAAAPAADASQAPARAAGYSGAFVPAHGPDFVATYVAKRGWGPPGDDTETVSRSGGWVRIDRIENQHASTLYVGVSVPVSVSLARDETGGYLGLQINAAAYDSSPAIKYDSFRTGAVETVLGERCEVWNIYRVPTAERGASGFARTGCVNADGVELWRRTVGGYGEMSSARALRVERRPVGARAVHPPRDLLDLRAWGVADVAGPRKQPDFEVVFGSDFGINRRPMIIRRRLPWIYEDTWDARVVRTVSSRRLDGLTSLAASVDADGKPKGLSIQRRNGPNPEPPGNAPATGKSETVLGERCAWVNTTPNTYDYTRLECRTDDGVPLRIRIESRGGSYGYTATRLRRRPLRLAEVLPPAHMLKPGFWGLPK
jgi:hypothetical protein